MKKRTFLRDIRAAIAAGTEDKVTHLVNDDMMRAFTVISGHQRPTERELEGLVRLGGTIVAGPNGRHG